MENEKNIETPKRAGSGQQNASQPNNPLKGPAPVVKFDSLDTAQITTSEPKNPNSGSAGTAVAKAKDTAATFVDQAKAAVGDAYSTASDKATSAIDDKKAGLVTGLEGAAQTARRVGEAMADDDGTGKISEYAARYTETGAKKLEDLAGYFEANDLKGMARDVESFARRNPAVFLGAAFALGVVAARFIKSGPPAQAASAAASTGTNMSSGDTPNRSSGDTWNRSGGGTSNVGG
jgi:hypothetical protein